jgi:hypothetical protein
LRSKTDRDAVEYNRLLELVDAASGGLTHYLVIIHLLVGQLQTQFWWYLTALMWADASVQKNRAKEIAESLLNGLVDGVGLHWRELRALEMVLAEIAEEVGGEDLLHEDARELFERTKEQLQILSADLDQRGGKCRLEEPTEEAVEVLAARIRRTW